MSEQNRRACVCPEPDPVMQADAKFYCHGCSFETGARPHLLEPENLMSALRQLQEERDRLRDDRDLEKRWRKDSDDRATTLEEQLTALRAEIARLTAFVERRGYRCCDIAACNCNEWHGGHAEDRLREISESLGDAGATGTVHGAVLQVIARAEAAEASLAALQSRIAELVEKWRANADMLAEGNKGEWADPSVGMQQACADQLSALLTDQPTTGHERSDEGKESRMATMGDSTDSRTASSREVK